MAKVKTATNKFRYVVLKYYNTRTLSNGSVIVEFPRKGVTDRPKFYGVVIG